MLLLSFIGLAFAQEPPRCAESEIVLETPEGMIGGTNLELDEETQVSIFSDGACLEAKGILLHAQEIRWDSKTQTLTVKELEAQTSRYRLKAKLGEVRNRVFTAMEVLATTCKCSYDLGVLAKQLRFDTQNGNIILEQADLELYGLELAHADQFELDAAKPPTFGLPIVSGIPGEADTLRVPIVLGVGNGPNVGVQDFPLLGDQEKGSSTSFTTAGYNLGSSEQELRFGIATSEPGASARVEVFNKAGQTFFYSILNHSPLHFGLNSETQLYTARFAQTWRQWGFSLTPFVTLTSELEQRDNFPKITSQGLSLGSELRYGLQLQEGAFGVRLEPFSIFSVYDAAPFYWAFGGRVEAIYNQGFMVRLAYEHSQNFDNRDSRFSFERRDPKSLVSAGFSYQPIRLQASYDFVNVETKASARYGLRFEDGELWGEGRVRFTKGVWTQQEFLLGFNPKPLDCTFSYSLAPKLGYDLLRNGFSRLGLEVRYADCCFVWKLGFEAVLIPQTPNPKDDPGRFVFGIEIR